MKFFKLSPRHIRCLRKTAMRRKRRREPASCPAGGLEGERGETVCIAAAQEQDEQTAHTPSQATSAAAQIQTPTKKTNHPLYLFSSKKKKKKKS
jgi:hypothetical protein